MSYPDAITNRFSRLRQRVRSAERIVGFGVCAMTLTSLLRTMQTLPDAPAEALYAWSVCAATLLGWALVAVGMRLTIQAMIADMEHEARVKKIKRKVRSAKAKSKASNNRTDADTLHRAVWALAQQSKIN